MNQQQLDAIARAQAKIAPADARAAAIQRALAKTNNAPDAAMQPSAVGPTQREVSQIAPAPSAAIADELYRQGPVGVRYLGPQSEVAAADGSPQVYDAKTGQYTNRELMAARMNPSAVDAAGAGALQGITMGVGDELFAGSSPLQREKIRAATDAAKRDHPVASTVGEIGGAMSVPLGSASKADTLRKAMWTGATAGSIWSALYSFNQAEGGIDNRLKAAGKGAAAGFVVGGLAPVVLTGAAKGLKAVFGRAEKAPNIENLRAAKTAAYRAADEAGETFSAQDMASLYAKVSGDLAATNYVTGVDRQTDAVLTLLERKSAEGMTLGQLDKLRQSFWKRYNAAPNETGILDAIDAIDGLIASREGSSALMSAARASNSAYKKAEMLDLAFQKARDQTAATGSGGNILNKYRQAVTSIVNNPNKAKWFSTDEVDAMRGFLQGSMSENVLRRIGKLAPGGNGLMLALNIGAVGVNPAMLGVTAASSAAKALSDRSTAAGAERLIGKVSGGATARSAPVVAAPPNALNAYLGSRF